MIVPSLNDVALRFDWQDLGGIYEDALFRGAAYFSDLIVDSIDLDFSTNRAGRRGVCPELDLPVA